MPPSRRCFGEKSFYIQSIRGGVTVVQVGCIYRMVVVFRNVLFIDKGENS